MKEYTYEKIKQWKKDNPEKQKEYYKRWYNKNKNIRNDEDYEEKQLQSRLDYIRKLFEK